MKLRLASALGLLALVVAPCLGVAAEPEGFTPNVRPEGQTSSPAAPGSEPRKPVVVIDPGHGGADPGARGPTGLIEKDLALQFAQAIRRQLEQSGASVLLTREGDQNPTLDDRAAFANSRRADLFLTIHFSSATAARMVRAFVYRIPSRQAVAPAGEFVVWEDAQKAYLEQSRAFAQLLDAQLQSEAPGSSAGVGEASLRVLRGVTCPAIALEVGSVSVQDVGALAGFDERLGRAIAAAVGRFAVTRSAVIGRSSEAMRHDASAAPSRRAVALP